MTRSLLLSQRKLCPTIHRKDDTFLYLSPRLAGGQLPAAPRLAYEMPSHTWSENGSPSCPVGFGNPLIHGEATTEAGHVEKPIQKEHLTDCTHSLGTSGSTCPSVHPQDSSRPPEVLGRKEHYILQCVVGGEAAGRVSDTGTVASQHSALRGDTKATQFNACPVRTARHRYLIKMLAYFT